MKTPWLVRLLMLIGGCILIGIHFGSPLLATGIYFVVASVTLLKENE